MAILRGRCSGDGKISNQAKNTKTTEENPAAEVTCVSALLPTGAPALFLSDDDEKDLTSSCVPRPSHGASLGISTSDVPPLLADRTPDQRATSLPTWLNPQPPEAFLGHLQWDDWGMSLFGYSWGTLRNESQHSYYLSLAFMNFFCFFLLRNNLFTSIYRVKIPSLHITSYFTFFWWSQCPPSNDSHFNPGVFSENCWSGLTPLMTQLYTNPSTSSQLPSPIILKSSLLKMSFLTCLIKSHNYWGRCQDSLAGTCIHAAAGADETFLSWIISIIFKLMANGWDEALTNRIWCCSQLFQPCVLLKIFPSSRRLLHFVFPGPMLMSHSSSYSCQIKHCFIRRNATEL